MAKQKKADIVLDIGDVIVNVDLTRIYETINRDDLKRILGDGDAFARGEIDTESYLNKVMKQLPSGVTRGQFIAAYQGLFSPILPMWATIRRLHEQGHRLLYFSNTNPLHVPWIPQQYDIFELFSGGLSSYEVGFLKPELGFYKKMISTFGLTPKNTIYADDRQENVDAGNKIGFQSWCYDKNKHGEFLAWLEGKF